MKVYSPFQVQTKNHSLWNPVASWHSVHAGTCIPLHGNLVNRYPFISTNRQQLGSVSCHFCLLSTMPGAPRMLKKLIKDPISKVDAYWEITLSAQKLLVLVYEASPFLGILVLDRGRFQQIVLGRGYHCVISKISSWPQGPRFTEWGKSELCFHQM